MKQTFRRRAVPGVHGLGSLLCALFSACGAQPPDSTLDVNPLVAFEAGGDPFFAEQWYLKNTGQESFSSSQGSAGEDIGLGSLHENGFLGAGVRVAVSDTGVDYTHEDLADRMLNDEAKDYAPPGAQTVNAGPELSFDAPSAAHGTAVAGLIAATGWNGFGTRGVAPLSSIVALRFIGVDVGLDDILDQASGELDIYNYSYGFSTCEFSDMEPGLHTTLSERAQNGRAGKGTIYVKAAGNEFQDDASNCTSSSSQSYTYYGNSNLDQMNTAPEVIVVGAINAQGKKSSYSSPGSNLWISAPGGEYGESSPAILTTDITGCRFGFSSSLSSTFFDLGSYGNGECNYTNTMNGTSSATPLVSGVIALMLEAEPQLSWREVKRILALTARRVDALAQDTSHPSASLQLSGITYQQGWVENAAGRYFHNYYGFGGVNAEAAVDMARTFTPGSLGATQSVTVTRALAANIPDRSSTGVSQTVTVAQSLAIESVVIRVNITHTFASDLGIELVSPAGTRSILMNINSGIVDESLQNVRFLSNAFLDENSSGTWTLRVIDGYLQDVGTLDSWSLEITGVAE
jgi:subtilisin family serine protease